MSQQHETSSLLLSRVVVKQLFGRYNYDLDLSAGSANLAIFYGDNGSGKTTILRLLYHMLSTALLEGHNTFIARLPVELFEITYVDGSSISVSRDTPKPGNYTMKVINKGITTKATMPVSQTGVILNPDEIPGFYGVNHAIDELTGTVFFLSDDRELLSDSLDDETHFSKQTTKIPLQQRGQPFPPRPQGAQVPMVEMKHWLIRWSV